MTRPFTVLHLIPTGIGAEIGGYAGDATPATNLLAAACDRLLTHPNVVNAASLYAARQNVWYVEGGALDRFALGEWCLRGVRANRIGLLIDRAIADEDPAGLAHLLMATDAMRTVHGVSIVGWGRTAKAVRSRIVLSSDQSSAGEVENEDVLISGAESLMAQGAEAIALVTKMPELQEEATESYLKGRGPDPIGGLEAILSRVISRALMIPCAHAPYESPGLAVGVDPRAAAESIAYTFLPCILEGLRRSPRPVPREAARGADLGFADVDAVVAPWNACGGIPVLAAARAGIPIVAVKGNEVFTSADPLALGFEVLEATSYLEAAGLLLAIREGVDPQMVRRPIDPLRELCDRN